eukprot:661916-Rhodomonas_salina.1
MLALRLSFAMCALLFTTCPSAAVSKVTLVVLVVVGVLTDPVAVVRAALETEAFLLASLEKVARGRRVFLSSVQPAPFAWCTVSSTAVCSECFNDLLANRLAQRVKIE